MQGKGEKEREKETDGQADRKDKHTMINTSK